MSVKRWILYLSITHHGVQAADLLGSSGNSDQRTITWSYSWLEVVARCEIVNPSTQQPHRSVS